MRKGFKFIRKLYYPSSDKTIYYFGKKRKGGGMDIISRMLSGKRGLK
tara:strand:- start:3159 stop:3299 length:141 start_codon:yes stop_codon:yes gene_type:complete